MRAVWKLCFTYICIDLVDGVYKAGDKRFLQSVHLVGRSCTGAEIWGTQIAKRWTWRKYIAVEIQAKVEENGEVILHPSMTLLQEESATFHLHAIYKSWPGRTEVEQKSRAMGRVVPEHGCIREKGQKLGVNKVPCWRLKQTS